jgi:hypothetical protein
MPKIFNPLTNRIVKDNGRTGKMIKIIKDWQDISKIKTIAKNIQQTHNVLIWEEQFLKLVFYHNPSRIESAKKIIQSIKKQEEHEYKITFHFPSFSQIVSNFLDILDNYIIYTLPYMENMINEIQKAQNYKYMTEYISRCSTTKKKCDCVICFNYTTHKDVIVHLHCNHEFHKKCILKWFLVSYNCPICKESIRKYELRIQEIEDSY